MNTLSLLPEDDAKDVGYQPLADRLRPKTLEDVVGQKHVLQADGLIAQCVEKGHVPSLIFWGLPGTGKTTLARIIAHHVDGVFHQVSGVTDGVKELRILFERAKMDKAQGKKTLLFVDEIHRFNRSQQDAFLPYVENGTFILIGATTENPSFELNGALLSRCQTITLKPLGDDALFSLLERAEFLEDKKLPIDDEARGLLVKLADGDARYLLNTAETLFNYQTTNTIQGDGLLEVIQRKRPVYDKAQDSHYNLISALHKSLRGSDPDAALYWFSRMLDGGEDPRYISRRLIRFASEDIGLADPQALPQALAAHQTYEMLGSPEGELAIAQALIYLATAPKSNAAYVAYKLARTSAKESASFMPPKHILNAPTSLMKDEGYGASYQYDHDTPEGFSGQEYFPDEMKREQYYEPKLRGFERDIHKRLNYWQELRAKKAGK